jgi:hypothetical protein
MLILYRCNLCSNEIKKLYQPSALRAPFLYCQCGGVLEKQLPDFSVNSFETVDNGNMAKKVQLRKDAVEKAKEKGDNYTKTMMEREKVIKKDEN